MKILSFSAYFTPEKAASMYLTENIFEGFAEDGNQVELYVPTPTRGVTVEERKKYGKIKKEVRCGGRFIVHRFSLYAEKKNTLLRAIRYVFLEIIFFFRGLFKKCDIIFVQSTPPIQGMMAAVLKRLKRVPFVYNLQDIFPDSLVNTGMTREGSFLWKTGRIIENYTYRSADKIVVISEDFKNNIMAKGVPEEKIAVIENWVDENAVVSVSRGSNSLFDKYGLDRDKFYICYSGNIGFTQNMDMLLDAAKELMIYKDIGFVIIGDGAYRSKVEERVKSEDIKNVTLMPFQPYEDISQVFSLGDAGLIISKPGVGTNSVPSKTWSIMSAGRSVIASFDRGGGLDRVITETGCGICVPPDDAGELKSAVLDFYENRDRLAEMGERGRDYILKNLTREIGVGKWNHIIRELNKGFTGEKNESI